MKNEFIRFENVFAGYGKKTIAGPLNFSVYDNDYIGLVGPNGAGKTTLLKTLLGSLKPVSGIIKKEDVLVGYVPQRDVLQPLLPYSVYDIVMMGRYGLLKTFQKPSVYDCKIVEESLEHVGIYHLMHSNYNSLSGGQRQRTLIARALAVKPKILVLDEPTNGMDTPSHHILLNLIARLHTEDNLTIILVSHLLTDVANAAHKIMLLEKDKFQFGTVEEILSEENLNTIYTSDFHVQKMNGEYIITMNKLV